MLSISPPRNAQSVTAYFRDHLVSAPGATGTESTPGTWSGRAAEYLGLTEPVSLHQLVPLLVGVNQANQPLVQNAGDRNRRSAWDLTFSCPKSVSVLWALSDEDLSSALTLAHTAAATEAFNWIESQAGLVRRGKGGKRRDPAQLVAACYDHCTSRALDPQLHSHFLVINIGICKDGHTGALETRPIFRAKMEAGATYRGILQSEIEQLGIATEKDSWAFRIQDIPYELERLFSKRRKVIEKRLDEWGASSARAAEMATVYHRPEKVEAHLHNLKESWNAQAKQSDLVDSIELDLTSQTNPLGL